MTRRVVIDTDPGQDDAVALLVALASPELDVVAVTAVAGNVPLELTERNARMMVELAGRSEVPVHAGCQHPLLRPLLTAEYVHGPSGIDGAELADPAVALAEGHAVDAIIDIALASHERDTDGDAEGLTLCTLGPLTNVATALAKEPRIASHITELVMMGGGSFTGGNVTPAAEFNIHVDPHAAHIVFSSGIPITMMPLDVTHQALTTDARIARFRTLGTPAGIAVAGMLDYFDRYDEEKYGSEGGPLHDPCVIAYLLDPGLFSGKRCHVAVEHSSELTMGATVIDWWGVTGKQPNALVMNEVDADGFFDLLIERIGLIRPG